MSEMTARERIAELLEDVSRPSERVLHNEENVDRIIAIVREALLSGKLVDALSKRVYEQGIPPALSELDGSPTWEEACERQHSITAYIGVDVINTLRGHIDAAFGPYKEDGGEGRPSERVEDVRGKYNRGEIQTAGEIVQAVMDAHDPDVISDLLEYNRTRGTKQ